MNVEQFALPLKEPLVTAGGTIYRREGFLCRCSHAGRTGVGEATPLPGWTESVAECQSALADARSTANSGDLQAAVRTVPRSATAARHGLSTALLDADAKAEGVPLRDWFTDGATADAVPVNATVGDHDPDETARRAEAYVGEGYECCKLKVGARPVEADLDRVAAVRAAVGDDDVELRVDANGNWTRDQADYALERLADQDVSLVEQPLPAGDLSGLADLRGGPVDVAVDESLVEHAPGEILDASAADVLVLKPMVLGGPGEAYTIATWARDRGLDVVVTTTIDAVVARTAAVHVAAALSDVRPCGLATWDLLSRDLGPDPAPVSGGKIAVPDDPGLGLEEVSVDE